MEHESIGAMSTTEVATVTAVFPDARRAAEARAGLAALGIAPADIVVTLGSGTEARVMWRIVLVIVAWSVVGTVLGAALGAGIALTVGPSGTEGLIIQMVTWAIFAHLVAGMWAGYLLLADRSGREIGAGRCG